MTATNMCYNFVGFGCSPPIKPGHHPLDREASKMISLFFFLMATMNDHILAFTVVFLCILGIVQNPINLEKGGPPGWISNLSGCISDCTHRLLRKK